MCAIRCTVHLSLGAREAAMDGGRTYGFDMKNEIVAQKLQVTREWSPSF